MTRMCEVTCRKTGLKKLYAGLEHGVKLVLWISLVSTPKSVNIGAQKVWVGIVKKQEK